MSKNNDTPSFEQIKIDHPATHVARITMARPESANAQGVPMTYELNDAFKLVNDDPEVRVIILAGEGKHFNAGHDLLPDDRGTLGDFPFASSWSQPDEEGYARMLTWERELYLEMTERWRNLSKPTIAQIQGKCIAGGMMLAWCCDLIVAAENAEFRDHTLAMGVVGAEFFNHAYELGVRKAKEWLLTAEWLSAEEARELGMVNRVVPLEELATETLKLAQSIAQKPPFAARLVKQALNHAQDAMGRRQAMETAFYMHQLSHAHNYMVHGLAIDPQGVPEKLRPTLEAFCAQFTNNMPKIK